MNAYIVLPDSVLADNDAYITLKYTDASVRNAPKVVTEKCMITDAAYQMYLGAEQDRIAREQKQAQENAVLGRCLSHFTFRRCAYSLPLQKEYSPSTTPILIIRSLLEGNTT